MDSYTWGSEEGQAAAVEAAFAVRDRFTMELNRTDFAMLLRAVVMVSECGEATPEVEEWAQSFAGSMVEVDWV